jgi:hypothetical protein
VITQAFALDMLELDVGDKDSGTFELKAIWNAF